MKCVIITAPHTTWFDTPFIVLLAIYLNMRIYWMGKEEMFRWPLKGAMLWLGGIPIRRGERGNRTDFYGKVLHESEKPIQLVIAPSGTRKNTPVASWKRGYKDIAEKGGVPILLGYINYLEKKAGIGAIVDSAQDYTKIVAIVEKFYEHYVPVNK